MTSMYGYVSIFAHLLMYDCPLPNAEKSTVGDRVTT